MRFFLFGLALFFIFPNVSSAQVCTVELSMEGAIGAGSLDVYERAESLANEKKCSSLLILLNTPGGSVDSTRQIVSRILGSPRPVLCLIYPEGGHAGSAGAIILQACHVNGAVAGTNLGAATPILGSGESAPEDLRKKMVNDMTSWMDSLTNLRGRNKEFGRQIIVDAKAVSAKEAHEIGAIDLLVASKSEFLSLASGKTVKLSEGVEAEVVVGDLIPFLLDLRFKLLSLISDPQLAYLLFLGSLALLYFEFTHPGTLIAGVVGGLGLVLSLIALHKLNVEWGGLLMILLGVGMLIAEIFVPSFGALGIGGIAAFIFGSLFLFDPLKTGGYTLPLSTILIATILFGGLFLGIGYLVLKTFGLKKTEGLDDLIGKEGLVKAVEVDGQSGSLECDGEIWSFHSDEPTAEGQRVVILSYENLKLKVRNK